MVNSNVFHFVLNEDKIAIICYGRKCMFSNGARLVVLFNFDYNLLKFYVLMF